jgi:hypothetical protein
MAEPGSELDPAIAAGVAAAVVRLPGKGLGVLVPGNLVITAAHCIAWTAEGWMAQADNAAQIEAGGRRMIVNVLAVEPVADVAVIGASDEDEAFEEWCEKASPISLYTDSLPSGVPLHLPEVEGCLSPEFTPSATIAAHVWTHRRHWIKARVRQLCRDASHLAVEVDTRIAAGTSGGPVIADDGRLLGVISVFSSLSFPIHGCPARFRSGRRRESPRPRATIHDSPATAGAFTTEPLGGKENLALCVQILHHQSMNPTA